MHYCLNKEELRQLIDLKVNNVNIENDNLRIWVDSSENWLDELGVFSYLFGHILEKKYKCGDDCQSLIEVFYHLEETMFLSVQEFDFKFIDYMLRNLRGTSISLEDELIELQNNLRAYKYGQTLRY
jgi:hypothetical protein